MKNFRLLSTYQRKYCILRKYFDDIKGEPAGNKINFDTLEGIPEIEDRPKYSSSINVLRCREINKNTVYSLLEIIYTNEPFLSRFKSFLRAISEDVKAEGFDDVPKKHIESYETPFTGVPVYTREISATLREPDKLPKLLCHKEIFLGVDFEDKATLRMVKAETIEEKLKEIEKESNFSAMIVHGHSDEETALKTKLEAMEVKHGGFHFAVTSI